MHGGSAAICKGGHFYGVHFRERQLATAEQRACEEDRRGGRDLRAERQEPVRVHGRRLKRRVPGDRAEGGGGVRRPAGR